MRTRRREPFQDSKTWLRGNYKNTEVVEFVKKDRYSFDMKDIAEEDYIYSLEQAEKHENNEYRIWASNIRKNDYMVIF